MNYEIQTQEPSMGELCSKQNEYNRKQSEILWSNNPKNTNNRQDQTKHLRVDFINFNGIMEYNCRIYEKVLHLSNSLDIIADLIIVSQRNHENRCKDYDKMESAKSRAWRAHVLGVLACLYVRALLTCFL